MTRIEMHSKSTLSANDVIAALTDFTERRPEIWPEIAPKFYEVHSVDETTAEVREGTIKGPLKIWARERYDWSTPGIVTWTVQESNFCTPGSYVRAEIKPRFGGGSEIHTVWERTATTAAAAMMFRMLKLSKGKMIESSLKQGLANYARLTGATTY